jgi:hypothetical protein
MRKVVIYSRKKLNIPKQIKHDLAIRHTKIQQKLIKTNNKIKEHLELYGYDQQLKYKSYTINKKTLKNIIHKIDKMPMGSLELQIRQHTNL